MDYSTFVLQSKYLKRRESFIPFSDANGSYEKVKSVLSLPSEERSDGQIASLELMTKGLKFFSDLRENVGEYAHTQCCRFMTFSVISGGKCVFREGELGSKFYIILSGSCAVLTETRKSGCNPDFQLLAVLRTGDSFGELALISKKPRSATVFCRENCSFAVLERAEYSDILKLAQEKMIKEKTEMLSRHPAFTAWEEKDISLLANCFQIRNTKRKQCVFTAGQPATEVFLVEEGTFQLSKAVSQPALSFAFCRGGRKQTEIITVRRGDLLGAGCALQGITYDCSCICVSGYGRTFVVDAKHFKRLVTSEVSIQAICELEQIGENSPGKRRTSSTSSSISRPFALRPSAAEEKPMDRSMLLPQRPKLAARKEIHRRNPSDPITDLSSSLQVIRHKRNVTMAFGGNKDREATEEAAGEKKKKLPGIQPTTTGQVRRKVAGGTAGIHRNVSLPVVLLADKSTVVG